MQGQTACAGRCDGQSCTPGKTPTGIFPMSPGIAMPAVEGCSKQGYQVRIVLGRMFGV